MRNKKLSTSVPWSKIKDFPPRPGKYRGKMHLALYRIFLSGFLIYFSISPVAFSLKCRIIIDVSFFGQGNEQKTERLSAKVQVQAEDGNGAVNLYLEGNRGTEKKHYFTAQPFAVSGRSEIVHTKQLPEDVNGIAIRLDLNKPAVYRIFNAAISAK